MPQKTPKVSVLMPAYNVEKYVGAAIESILNQTFTDFEFIIINDGSTDNTAKIIKEYAKKDKRIRFIDNKENKGFIARLNDCLDLARGEYVAKMDSDDISLPERFQKQVDFLDTNLDIGMVGAALKAFGDADYVLRHPEKVGIIDFVYGCKTTIFMARREIIEKNNLRFDSNYFSAEDYEFYSRFARVAKIANIQDVLYMYRWHGKNVSKEKANIQQETSKRISDNVINFVTGDKYMINKLSKMYRWIRVLGVPFIKIKTYNLSRSKYYLFGFLPLVMVENEKVYLFGGIKIGNIK